MNAIKETSKNFFVRNQKEIFYIILYFVLPWIIFGIGYNLMEYLLAPGDGAIAGYPLRQAISEYSFWSPYTQGGSYLAREGSAHCLYLPALLIMNIFPNVFGYNFLLLIHYSFAGVFTYLFLKELKIKQIAAFFGGLVFMFSGFLSAHLGHINMLCAAIFLPAVLLVIEKYVQHKKIIWLLAGALFFMLTITADYWAMPFYIGMVGLPYLIFRWICVGREEGQKARTIVWQIVKTFSIIYIGGLLLSAFYCLPIFQAFQYTTRGNLTFEVFASYGFPAYLFPTLLFPYIFTYSMNTFMFYGPWNNTELFGYMPIFVLIFAAVAILCLRKKNVQIWFWTILAVFAFILVLGDNTPFYKLAYQVPGYNMFRAPGRNWYEVHFALSILFAFGLNAIIGANKEKREKFFKAAIKTSVVIGVLAVATIIVLFSLRPIMIQFLGTDIVLPNFVYTLNDIAEYFVRNMNFTNPAVYIPIIIILLCIIWCIFGKKYGWTRVTSGIFAGILLINIFYYGHWVYGAPTQPPVETPVLSYLKEEGGDANQYRIYPMDDQPGVSPMGNMINKLNVINTYSTVPMRDYATLTGLSSFVADDPELLVSRVNLLSAMGVKYIVTNNSEYKEFIKSVYPSYSEGNNLVGDSDGWDILTGEFLQDSFKLESGEDNYSLMQTEIPLKKYTNYKISFLAKGITDVQMFADLFAEGYDQHAQQLDISVAQSDDFERYSFTLNSGDCPSRVMLRIGIQGLGAVEVMDVSLRELVPNETAAYEKVFEDEEGNTIYYNPQWVNRAHFATEILPVSDIEEVNTAFSPLSDIDPQTQALVEGIDQTENMGNGSVLQEDYSDADAPKFKVYIDGQKGFFVLSDTYYTGWEVYVDGVQTTIYKTNGIMRGVFVEGEGEHTIEFRFVPGSFYKGLVVTFIALGGLIAVVFLQRRKNGKKTN